MDLLTDYFITCDVNYVCDYKKFAKGVVVFEITLTVAAISSNVLQGNGKGSVLNKPLLLKLGSLYLLANDALKYYLCLFTGYIYTNCPLKKTF